MLSFDIFTDYNLFGVVHSGRYVGPSLHIHKYLFSLKGMSAKSK